MGQEDLSAFDGGVSERTPVAWSYEVKETAGPNGHTKQDWTRHLQREEPYPSDWRKTDTEYYHLRKVIPLRYSREVRPEDALGYEFKYENHNGGTSTGLSKTDPRGPDSESLIDCKPLVPIEDE
jgi:hypothetical protein